MRIALTIFLALLTQSFTLATTVKEFYKSDNKHRFVRFTIDSKDKEAFVFTNEVALAGGLPMEFIANVQTSWPLFEGQVIPLVWHVGSTTGDCYFDATLEITKVGLRSFMSEWTIPAHITAECLSYGKRIIKNSHGLKALIPTATIKD